MAATNALFVLTSEIMMVERKMLERRLCVKGLDMTEGIIMMDL